MLRVDEIKGDLAKERHISAVELTWGSIFMDRPILVEIEFTMTMNTTGPLSQRFATLPTHYLLVAALLFSVR